MTKFFTKSLSRTFLTVLTLAFFTLNGVAQSTTEKAPNVQNQSNSQIQTEMNTPPTTGETPFTGIGTPAIDAQWDIQFDYNPSDTTSDVSLAGALLVGTEFWVSQWNSDKLYRLTSTGSFIDSLRINDGAGGTVGGTRSLTTDGTSVYLGTASTTIYEVNPTTYTVTSTITSAGGTARFLTYDPSADAGAGGFWLANFNTDIELISRTGAVLATIPVATHGLGGMYGAAYDGISTGGPYLWVFAQTASPSNGMIHQLSLPSGAPTGVTKDVDADFGDGTGLAGGLFITDQLVTGKNTIGGILQGFSLFGYELDFVPIQIDASFQAAGLSPAFGQMPMRFNPSLTTGGSVSNFGIQTITNLNLDLTVDYGGSQVHSEMLSFMNLANLGNQNFSFAPYTPTALGDYTFNMTASTGAQIDEVPGNNSVSFPFSLTDTVLARDNGVPDGGNGYAVSNTDAAIALTLFDFPADVYLQGVEIELATPNDGDMTNAVVVFSSNNAPSGAPLLSSNPVAISAAQTTYYLPLTAELPISAGQVWGIGVTEGANTTINLAQSTSYFSPGVNFFSTDNGTSWTPSNLPTARFIRPVIASCNDFALDLTAISYNPDWNQQGSVEVTALNGRGSLTIQWDDANNSTTALVPDLMPGTYTVTVTDANSCTATQSIEVTNTTAIEDDLAAGINEFKIFPNPTQGLINLNIELSQVSDLSLELVDLNGRTVYTESRQKVNVYNNTLNLSSLSKGVYMLQATTAQGRTFKRVILD